MLVLIALFLVGWTAAAIIGTQAYFRGEQSKPIHQRNWNSDSFEQLSQSITGTETIAARVPAFVVDDYYGGELDPR